MGPFGEYLKDRLSAHGLSVYALCKKLGKSTGNISNIMHERPIPGGKADSKYKPPLDEMDRWADAIGMDGQEREKLKELAEMAHYPPGLRSKLHAVRSLADVTDPVKGMETLTRAFGGQQNRPARREFGTFVDELLGQRGIDRKKFAELVGLTIGKINGILDENPRPSQRLSPPLEDLFLWAEKLRMNEADGERLFELAELVHTPPAIRDRYLAMKAVLPQPVQQAASTSETYDEGIDWSAMRELERSRNPDDHARPPAPTYPRPAPVRRGTHDRE